jgi:NAD(P)-dependent dehydrogenase (short-subunit alcohol dehydrogenase family)
LSFAKYPSLAGRVVLVTGGASGIGADIVRAFHGQAAKVAFLDLQAELGESFARELGAGGSKPLFIACDVTDVERLRAAIEEIRHQLGPIGVLVNNAANDERHELASVTPEYWRRAIDLNLTHQFFACQAVHPHMQQLGGGVIVNLSSIAWHFGPPEMPVYAAAKAGVTALTYSLARKFGPDNIRVNAIEPGAVMTERQRRLWYKTPEAVEAMVQRQVLKKTLLGEEIARAALFLAADDSRMITKQTLVVDAGMR